MMNIFKRTRNKLINSKPDQDSQRRFGGESGQSGLGHQSGQSLVEMAIMMVLLLIIMGGVLDLGRMYFTYLALQNAAGEGASYGAINPEWKTATDNDDPNNITYRVQNESTGNLIDWSQTNVVIETNTIAGGQPITVTVTYDYEIITPMVQVITGEEVTLRAWDTQLIYLTEDDD